MRRLLFSALAIVLVLGLVGVGTSAWFQDIETSTGNTFTAGTLDLKIGQVTYLVTPVSVGLNPNYGYDTTDTAYTLGLADLAKLARSDGDRYRSQTTWETTYWDDEYIEFGFPDIPPGVTVTSVELKFEWSRGARITGARLRIWDSSTWQIYTFPTPLPGPGETVDGLVTLNLMAPPYEINTAAKVNDLKIQFQAVQDPTHPPGGCLRHTWHNWVQVNVGYTVTTVTEVWADGVSATWVMANMVPGVTTVTNSIYLSNTGSVAAHHVEISFSHRLDEGPPLESDTNWASDPGDMARWIEITAMTYNGINLKAALADLNGNGFIDLEDVTLGANAAEGGPLDNLPPPQPNMATTVAFFMSLKFHAEATNDIQGDTLITTITFTLNQDISQ